MGKHAATYVPSGNPINLLGALIMALKKIMEYYLLAEPPSIVEPPS
jgi:hypothetical protein